MSQVVDGEFGTLLRAYLARAHVVTAATTLRFRVGATTILRHFFKQKTTFEDGHI